MPHCRVVCRRSASPMKRAQFTWSPPHRWRMSRSGPKSPVAWASWPDMELLFVTIGGAILGLIARGVLPWRATYGVAILPTIGAFVTRPVWGGGTWLGWKWDGVRIRPCPLRAGGLATLVVGLYLGPRHERADAALVDRLAHPGH